MALNLERARRRLMAVGIEEERADAIADVVADATDDLATKQDLAEVKAELKQDIAELKVGIAELRAELYRALWRLGIGLILAGTALLGIQTAILVALLG